jgi:ferrous iron transport protein A
MNLISLRRMTVGQTGTIARVKGGGAIGARIREMGLVPGAEILIMGRAPLNDPVHIKLHGYDLTLRNNEADHIMVKLAGTGEDGP